MMKRATVVAADKWLDQLVHQSPAFQAQVEEELAAINVAQDLVALRESRGLSQAQLADRLGITQSAIAQLESAQPKNVELRTLVRVATALGARVDVSIRPGRQAERKSRGRARPRARKPAAVRSPA
jgi:ribosome-binding protein aMBF1 (putative translation factor)